MPKCSFYFIGILLAASTLALGNKKDSRNANNEKKLHYISLDEKNKLIATEPTKDSEIYLLEGYAHDGGNNEVVETGVSDRSARRSSTIAHSITRSIY